MIKLTVLLSLIFVTSCSTAQNSNSEIQPLATPARELKKDIPNARWVKLFFEGYGIETRAENGEIREEKGGGLDDFAAQNGFSILKETVLPENDLEARVWVGFGKYRTDGFILKRSSGNWSASVLKGMVCHLENKGRFELPAPRSGWETAWQKLVAAGILVLPDSSKLKYSGDGVDGKGYVVETNSDLLYRTYHYGNPDYVKLKEAEQMVKIGQIVADEFGLESFSMETGGCSKND